MAARSEGISAYVPRDIQDKFEVLNYRNAAQILFTAAPQEFEGLLGALRAFSLTIAEIRKRGGNESDIPKKFSAILRPLGWQEMRIKGDLIITKITGRLKKKRDQEEEEDLIEELDTKELAKSGLAPEKLRKKNFLDGHKIDFVKGRVAFDVEWNSKDQTFDRDLYAFRAFYDCDLIDVAVIVTRSADLNAVFEELGPELDAKGKPRIDPKTRRPKLLKTKYGASTTWMGKLVYRLEAGRQGGCPVLALGIKRQLITDWED
ncbi:MAG: BglII/BstYI family type II restriction endonuclease [Gemmataceae bacterium]